MKITRWGIDYITIDENNIDILEYKGKIHLIKLSFENPTQDKLEKVFKIFPDTKRFIISDNIKIYYQLFKNTYKKYYIENDSNLNLISFFKKNNKVLFNFVCINDKVRKIIVDNFFDDILRNCEVILVDKKLLEEKKDVLKKWSRQCSYKGIKMKSIIIVRTIYFFFFSRSNKFTPFLFFYKRKQ